MTRLFIIAILASIIVIGAIPILVRFIKKWKKEKEERYAIYILNAKLLILACIVVEIAIIVITMLVFEMNLIFKDLL